MAYKEKIANYYANARFFIKQNNPKDARIYVLALLNISLKLHKQQTTIMQKANTQAFLEKWVAVSQDLYSKGITDYVRMCFNLPTMQDDNLPKPTMKPIVPNTPTRDSDIDLDGLIADISLSQGWCAALFEKCKRGVVQMRVSAEAHGASGTGFIISQNGYLLTNDHVVFDKEYNSYYPKIFMSLFGERKNYKITVIASDKKSDVALCCFNTDDVADFGVLPFIQNYDTLIQGADCVVIGNAFNFGLAPFSGTVRYVKDANGDLVHTALSNKGDSGGPVLNRTGEVIGIHKSNTQSVNAQKADGFANATPACKIEELLAKWAKQHSVIL